MYKSSLPGGISDLEKPEVADKEVSIGIGRDVEDVGISNDDEELFNNEPELLLLVLLVLLVLLLLAVLAKSVLARLFLYNSFSIFSWSFNNLENLSSTELSSRFFNSSYDNLS